MISAGTSRGPARTNRAPFLTSIRPVQNKGSFYTDRQRRMKRTHVALDELREINVPYLEGNRERENLDAPLVYFEAFLKVFVIFEECSIVDNNLGIRYTELQNFVIHGLCRLHGSEGLLEVDVERPKLERFEESRLHRKRLQKLRQKSRSVRCL